MDALAIGRPGVRALGRVRGGSLVVALFSGTMFLSAVLLFSAQPMFAKMVLPKLGGTPAVWAISMCFFQAVLLAGYGYAHLLGRYLGPRAGLIVHLTTIAVAALALPIALPSSLEPPAGDAYLWLTGVLGLGIGLPFFAVSANAPLLQDWFARTGHPHANDPYFLYGASNLGSLAALLAYPVVLEPLWGLSAQSRFWSIGFVLLGWFILATGLTMLMGPDVDADASRREVGRVGAKPPSWGQRLEWTGLALVPSGLLVAFTSYLTTDVASAPFVWVVPLAIYLATFVLVFRDRPLVPHSLLLVVQPFAVGLTLIGMAISQASGWMIASGAGFLAFLLTTLIAHRQLYERRPEPWHLTEFYLWMSLGGVLGGIFASIVSPQIFNTSYELPLLLMLGMLCRPGLSLAAAVGRRELTAAAATAVAGAILLAGLLAAIGSGVIASASAERTTLIVVLVLVLGLYAARCRIAMIAILTILTAITMLVLPNAMNQGEAHRSFFGTHRIVVEPIFGDGGERLGDARVLMHGTTIHGMERITDAEGQAVTTAPIPSSYYHPASPMFHALEAARAAKPQLADRPFTVGIVGLGAGTMTCHAKAGESWRMFEIDPLVVEIARTRFSYLRHCMPGDDTVIGDARLTLEREPPGRFDYLLLDAFSSDSIPVHLMTREAIVLYLDKLTPNGVLVLHVSNRHLDLAGVSGTLVASIPGLSSVTLTDRRKSTADAISSQVVVISRSARALEPLRHLPGAAATTPTFSRPWTDDYSNVLQALFQTYFH